MHISFSAKCLKKSGYPTVTLAMRDCMDPASRAGFRVEGTTHEAGKEPISIPLVDSTCMRSHTDVFWRWQYLEESTKSTSTNPIGPEMKGHEGYFPGLFGVHVKSYRFTTRSGRISSELVAWAPSWTTGASLKAQQGVALSRSA